MAAPQIQSFSRVIPMIYAYSTPGVAYHDGWLKIGYTEKQSVEDRIAEQTHTAGVHWQLEWKNNALYTDGSGEYFTDKAFHRYLTQEKQVPREEDTEWFRIDNATSRKYFYEFAGREIPSTEEHYDYTLRKEQQEAVSTTKSYFENGGTEFLWNAKPRFGKTLTSYDLIRQMGLEKILIVTNRPSIANSWAEDFHKFMAWRGEYLFVSDTDALRDKPGVLTKEEFNIASRSTDLGMVAFESLQGLKGSIYFGGSFDKLQWIKDLSFDLLIVDEAQEGIDTMRTDRAFRNIQRKYTLYLSGTPFKVLASEQFADDQIFNWSYADEQEAKAAWTGEEYNPYEALPKLSLFTYQLSDMIYDKIQRGADLTDGDTVDYAFDLNEFFATGENKKFIHEKEIRKFLHALVTQEKYPFSTPELRQELSHTLWLLNRVDSAKALANLLEEDPVFSEYEIVLAAGDGKPNEDDAVAIDKAFDRVKDAISKYDKTITLSVGQLTVGVTIPEWSGVLMLCNMKSPSSYMQAAFRAQNPCVLTAGSQRMRKETAYIFDFDPARTLIIYEQFANDLAPDTASGKGTSDDRQDNIKRLLNFFPVLGEDDQGQMVELDAAQVLSIPRKIKSQEVVRRGFLSNFLFQNISNVFGAPGIVREIIEKLTPAKDDTKKKDKDRDKETLSHMDEISVDEDGEVDVPQDIVIGKTQDIFGPKVYETIKETMAPHIEAVAQSSTSEEADRQAQSLIDAMKKTIFQDVVAPAVDAYDVKQSQQNRLKKQIDQEIEQDFNRLHGDYAQQTNIARAELDRERKKAETEVEVAAAETKYYTTMDDALKSFVQAAKETVERTIEEKPQQLVDQLEHHKKEEEKKTVEDTIRDHLRGFSRTIPSFIMAYGDENLKLANFDDYTEDEVFEEVTGITEDDFRFLRDGGDQLDTETGEMVHFEGHLFDEVVFNDSIQEFRHKQQALSNYFDMTQTEDIFDYIPPQKTNQIFTPRWVVVKMVDELEENNPGCFDDPDNTFADLYMKSGLYITEIVKRLFRSEKMKEQIPDDGDRIRHIFRHQVYGMAPTRIIYLIATNYILGFDETLKAEGAHFVEADAAAASKEGRLPELVEECFG